MIVRPQSLIHVLKEAKNLLLALLELLDLLGLPLGDLLDACVDGLLDGLLEPSTVPVGTSTIAMASRHLILMLQLLLHAQEAIVDLLLQFSDGLIRVDTEEARLVLLLRLHHEQVLVAERVLAQLELEE